MSFLSWFCTVLGATPESMERKKMFEMPEAVKNSQSDFDRALAFILKWEGGYVNDHDDPGGETKYGISKRSHPEYDIKNLTKMQAAAIYRRDYWDANGCSAMTWPLNVVVFDTAVNMGAKRAAQFLKKAIEPKAFLNLRAEHYKNLAEKNPKNKKFLKGWMNRLNDLRKLAGVT